MLVVNLCGGPGCGKSTTRAGLFHLLKIRGFDCDEAIEYVKQKVYEGNKYIFTDQLYILAKQAKILKTLEGKVKIAVSDSPLFLSSVYYPQGSMAFHDLVLEQFDAFNNLNILLNRVKPYQTIGRFQDEAEAKEKDCEVAEFMFNHEIPYRTVDGDEMAPERILKIIDKVLNGY
jgi:hypothetical protein